MRRVRDRRTVTQAFLLVATLMMVAAVMDKSLQAQGVRRGIGPRKNPPIPPDETVLPSETDGEIRTFDYPQAVYHPRQTARNQLVILLPGTNGKGPTGLERLSINAANLGYHVITPMYPNDIAATSCQHDEDPDAFAKFRWAIIEGGSSSHLKGAISRAESIENRIIKLLKYLQRKHADQSWGQFLNGDQIVWEKVVIGGMSQGGGHAALIATRRLVARVLCFGAPKDYNLRLGAPAAWYGKSETPPTRYFAFNNTHDRQGCDYRQEVEILNKLGVAQVAGIANVDAEPRPYHGARVLFTNWPGPGSSIASINAHTSVIDDGPWAGSAPLFRPVWLYMLSSSVS